MKYMKSQDELVAGVRLPGVVAELDLEIAGAPQGIIGELMRAQLRLEATAATDRTPDGGPGLWDWHRKKTHCMWL